MMFVLSTLPIVVATFFFFLDPSPFIHPILLPVHSAEMRGWEGEGSYLPPPPPLLKRNYETSIPL